MNPFSLKVCLIFSLTQISLPVFYFHKETIMAGVNDVTIIGNLGIAPDVKQLKDNSFVAVLSVATSRQWKDATTGENKELVEWHRIVLFKRLAEIAQQYLKKGSKVYVRGYLRTNRWTDTNQIERWTTEIIGENLVLLDPKNKTLDTPPVTGEIPSSELNEQYDNAPF